MKATSLQPSVDNVFNMSQLRQLKSAKSSEQDIMAVARQFESIFVKMMMNSMRKANELFSEGGIFDSHETKFYTDMFDSQLASDVSNHRGIGLAQVIARQLSGKSQHHSPVNTFKQQLVSGPAGNTLQSSSIIQSPLDFVRTILPKIQNLVKSLNFNPKALLAQSALETGWGSKLIKNRDGVNSHNLFNIKANKSWSGQKTVVPTIEYNGETAEQQLAAFKMYGTYEESIADYLDSMNNNPRYQHVLEGNGQPDDFFLQLQESGYATDPDYARKLSRIFHGDLLNRAISDISWEYDHG